MPQINTNTESVKKLSKFLVQKHSREEDLTFGFHEFGALRLYQATHKVLFEKCINDLLGNKQTEPSESVANTGNITFGQMNYSGALDHQYSTLTISSANAQMVAVNKIGVYENPAPSSLKVEIEKYIGNNYWLVNGVCKDIAQNSECPNALKIVEIGSYITSFLIQDSLLPPSNAAETAVELSGE